MQAVDTQLKVLPLEHPVPYFCSAPGCLARAAFKVWGLPHTDCLPSEGPTEWWQDHYFCCAEHKISEQPQQQLDYLAMRLRGTSHRLAEMFALQQPPMSNTDREFLEARGSSYDQFGTGAHAQAGAFYEACATEAGVSTTGKVYLSGLAAYPGDPRAWVSGRGDVQRVCEERGWSCEGSVQVDGSKFKDMTPPAEIAVAPDLVARHTEAALAADPGLLERPLEEVQEAVKERITPHWLAGSGNP